MKKILALVLCMMMTVMLLIGCAGENRDTATEAPVDTAQEDAGNDDANEMETAAGDLVFAFVAKDVNNPFMQSLFEGFENAANEMNVEVLFRGPTNPTPEMQIEILNQLIAQNVDLIAVTANDFDALGPTLDRAMDQGISVISFDSSVNPDNRMVHINQADPEMIGRVQMRAAHDIVNGEGGIGILSATAQASNQNLWIEWMVAEMEENPEKYANTPLIRIAYGDDDPTTSTNETHGLLADEDIRVIISPTTVGMLAAGRVLQTTGSDVKLTGLGTPADMYPFIEDGTVPWMYLWNPIDLGYLTFYAGLALVEGTITGAVGDIFTSGSLGEFVVEDSPDGGTEVLLGDPFRFDIDNIEEWKDVF
ncbi:MAG: substrate-binding domain-containing protein [Lachnospiraceae bacterium]|nr:substrate-binding domain-containing protein [Lachnospiraceae bacterium]